MRSGSCPEETLVKRPSFFHRELVPEIAYKDAEHDEFTSKRDPVSGTQHSSALEIEAVLCSSGLRVDQVTESGVGQG